MHDVPDFPSITAIFRTDNHVEVQLLGVSRVFAGTTLAEARGDALRYLWQLTTGPDFGRPVRVKTLVQNSDETSSLIVTPGGTYFDEADTDRVWSIDTADRPLEEQTDTADRADLVPDAERTDATDPIATSAIEHQAEVPAAPPVPSAGVVVPPPQPSRGAHAASPRKSFITAGRTVQPATTGWQGSLNKLGLRLGPGGPERSYREDVAAVSQHWPGPRTIAVANGKGSANKTPTTVMLAAVFARYGGAGVLAWDNNETRGSLPWRTERANHQATVLDLIPQVESLLGTTAQSAEMSHFTHHQPGDKYDVLWSDQSVAGDHVVSADDVHQIYRVASRYYRLIIMDSGNSERAPNWRAMVEHADTLVVPCTNVEDTPEAGALMLEALATRDDKSLQLANNSVAIVSQRTPGRDPNMERIARDIAPLVREVVRIPFDPALKSGVIHFEALRADTQRAWLRAAAAVSRGL